VEQTHRDGSEPVYALSEVLASCQKDYAVVALRGEEVVGACVGRAAHEQGWIVFCATKEGLEGRGIGPAMLAALEKRMSSLGLAKLSALMPADRGPVDDFLAQGFEVRTTMRYVERRIPVQREEMGALAELGGRVLPRGLWDAVGGMTGAHVDDRGHPRLVACPPTGLGAEEPHRPVSVLVDAQALDDPVTGVRERAGGGGHGRLDRPPRHPVGACGLADGPP